MLFQQLFADAFFNRRLASRNSHPAKIGAQPFQIHSMVQPQAEEKTFFQRCVFRYRSHRLRPVIHVSIKRVRR